MKRDFQETVKLKLEKLEKSKTFDANMEVDVEKSKYFGVCPVIRNNTSYYINDFTEEHSLLPGWKIKIIDYKDVTHKNGLRRKKVFLTPHKRRNITTSLGVLEYLRLQGKSRKDLETIAEHMDVNKTKFGRLFNDYYDDYLEKKKIII